MYDRELKSIYEKLNQSELFAFHRVVCDMEFEAKYNHKKGMIAGLLIGFFVGLGACLLFLYVVGGQ